MNRKTFLNRACQIGACSCSMIWLADAGVSAGTRTTSEDVTGNEWKIPFIQKRFAHMVHFMETKLNEEDRNAWIEEMGRACANEYKEHTKKYIGHPEDYLAQLEGKWIDEAYYEKTEACEVILIRGQKKEKCYCPFVDNEKMPCSFCSCSLGFQKEVFSTILEKPVQVELVNSILAGDQRCSFKIVSAKVT